MNICTVERKKMQISTKKYFCKRMQSISKLSLKEEKQKIRKLFHASHFSIRLKPRNFAMRRRKRFLHNFCFATIEKKLTLPLEKSRNPFFFVGFSMISLWLWPSSSFRSFFLYLVNFSTGFTIDLPKISRLNYATALNFLDSMRTELSLVLQQANF